jgi:hypothetical protein
MEDAQLAAIKPVLKRTVRRSASRRERRELLMNADAKLAPDNHRILPGTQ